jgi:hypothetical protein
MDADRTDPAIDAGSTCLYAVQTVDADPCYDCLQPPEACALCENGSMFIRWEDDVDYDPDDLGMDPDGGPEGWEHPWIPAKMRRIEKVRWVETGAQLRHNQWRREYARPMRKRMKRLSAIRRQGRGRGR